MKKRAIVTLLLTAPLMVTSCSSEVPKDASQRTADPSDSSTPTKPPVPQPVVTTNHTKSLPLDLNKNPLTFKVTQGQLVGVSTTNKDLKVTEKAGVKRATGLVDPGEKVRFEVVMTDVEGKRYKKPIELSGTSLKRSNRAVVYPVDNQIVGVGMPVTVTFNKPVKDKAYIEKHMKVTSVPQVEGSWGWLDNGGRAVWRPKTYWKPGTKVTAKINIKNLDFGKGVYGTRNVSTKFTIGKSVVLKADSNKHQVTVVENGKTIRNMKASFGKTSTQTRSGDFIIYAKANPERMVGEDYRQVVPHALRFTASGLYLHSAGWSVGDQGRRNVSHGCINLHPSDAKWLYSYVRFGDVVEVRGTKRKAVVWDGMGGAWALPYSEWKKLSAL